MGADAAASMPVQCGLLSVVSPETEFWLRRGIERRQSKAGDVITKKTKIAWVRLNLTVSFS